MKQIFPYVLLLCMIFYGCIQLQPTSDGTTTEPSTAKAVVTPPVQPPKLNTSNTTTNIAWNGTINVGFVGPLSGNASYYGKQTHFALQLAVDEINENGGINGAKLEMISTDGACSSAIAKKSAEGLIKTYNVQVIFGGLCSEEIDGMDQVVKDNRIVLLSPSATGTSKSTQDFVFTLSPSSTSAAEKLVSYAEKQNWIRAAIITDDTTYAKTFGEAFKNEFNNRGRVVSTYQTIKGTGSVETQVYSTKVTGPDVVVIFTQTPGRSAEVIKELGKSMTNRTLAGGEIETMLATIDAAGKNIQLTGLRTKYNKNNTGTQLFLKKYESKYGETCTVPWMAVTARDSLYLIASIMKDGGYTQNDGDVIRNELSNTKNWNGLSGNITFDQNGDAALEYEIVVIKS